MKGPAILEIKNKSNQQYMNKKIHDKGSSNDEA